MEPGPHANIRIGHGLQSRATESASQTERGFSPGLQSRRFSISAHRRTWCNGRAMADESRREASFLQRLRQGRVHGATRHRHSRRMPSSALASRLLARSPLPHRLDRHCAGISSAPSADSSSCSPTASRYIRKINEFRRTQNRTNRTAASPACSLTDEDFQRTIWRALRLVAIAPCVGAAAAVVEAGLAVGRAAGGRRPDLRHRPVRVAAPDVRADGSEWMRTATKPRRSVRWAAS